MAEHPWLLQHINDLKVREKRQRADACSVRDSGEGGGQPDELGRGEAVQAIDDVFAHLAVLRGKLKDKDEGEYFRTALHGGKT